MPGPVETLRGGICLKGLFHVPLLPCTCLLVPSPPCGAHPASCQVLCGHPLCPWSSSLHLGQRCGGHSRPWRAPKRWTTRRGCRHVRRSRASALAGPELGKDYSGCLGRFLGQDLSRGLPSAQHCGVGVCGEAGLCPRSWPRGPHIVLSPTTTWERVGLKDTREGRGPSAPRSERWPGGPRVQL